MVRRASSGIDIRTVGEPPHGVLMPVPSSQKQVNGVVPFLVGVITCLHFFPEDIACVSVMM